MEAQGIIYYEHVGEELCWEVSAHPTEDTPETLEFHFRTHINEILQGPAEFIGAEIWHPN